MEKLKELLKKAAEKIKDMGYSIGTGNTQSSMAIVYIYGTGLLIINFLFLIGWMEQWMTTGNPNLPILISYFREYTAASVVAAVTFLTVFNVDKNGDGRPDAAEVKAEGK